MKEMNNLKNSSVIDKNGNTEQRVLRWPDKGVKEKHVFVPITTRNKKVKDAFGGPEYEEIRKKCYELEKNVTRCSWKGWGYNGKVN